MTRWPLASPRIALRAPRTQTDDLLAVLTAREHRQADMAPLVRRRLTLAYTTHAWRWVRLSEAMLTTACRWGLYALGWRLTTLPFPAVPNVAAWVAAAGATLLMHSVGVDPLARPLHRFRKQARADVADASLWVNAWRGARSITRAAVKLKADRARLFLPIRHNTTGIRVLPGHTVLGQLSADPWGLHRERRKPRP